MHNRALVSIGLSCLFASTAFAAKQKEEDPSPHRFIALLTACNAPKTTHDGKPTIGSDVCESLNQMYKSMPVCMKEKSTGGHVDKDDHIDSHYKSEEVQKLFKQESTPQTRKEFAKHETEQYWKGSTSWIGYGTPSCARQFNLDRVHEQTSKPTYKPPTDSDLSKLDPTKK